MPKPTRTNLIIFLLFGLSGVAALIYEILWARELGLIFGTTIYAISTVLAVFFSGLALGSLIFGKIVDKQKKPLFLYAFLELGIGVYAILTPGIFQLIQQLQANLGGIFSLTFAQWSLLRFVLSFSALIIPSTLIGGTLPVIIKYFTQRLEQLGNVTAKLYSINTFGAVVGTILAGFFLILWFGVLGAIYFAAFLNIFIGLVVFFLWRKERVLVVAPPQEVQSPSTPGGYDLRLLIILVGFFISGFAALSLEVLWTRALILTIGISTYAFSIILITFLLGIALGSLIISRFIDRLNVWNTFGILEILRGGFVILLIPVFGLLPFWYLSIIRGLSWSFGGALSTSFIITILVLLLPTLLMGATFPVVAKIVTREFEKLGFSVGRAYLFNTFGGVAGSLAAGFLLVPLLGVQKSIVLAAGLYLLVGSVISVFSPSLKKSSKIAVIVIALLFLGGGTLMPDWNRFVLQSRVFTQAPNYPKKSVQEIRAWLERGESFGELIFYKEGISSLVAVEQGKKQKVLTINGKAQSGSELDKEPQLLLGHLPMLLHPNPKRAMVIGLGSGMTLGAVEQYPELEKVVVLEIEPEVVEAASYFSDANNNALSDPRLEIVLEDGRNYLLTTNETFDVISSEPSNPWIKGMANLYTKEFFELAKEKLNPGGLMVQWMQINALDKDDFRSFMATFQSVFPEVSLWETMGSIILVGSETGFGTFNVEHINQQFAKEKIRQDLGRMNVESGPVLFSHFVLRGESLKELVSGFPLHTDNRPFLEFSSPRSFYQSKENLIENLEFLNGKRVPISHYIKGMSQETEVEIKKYFDFRSHLILGKLAFLKNNFEEIVIAYEAARALFPSHTATNDPLKIAYAYLANRFEAKENYQEAEKYYKKLAFTFPEEGLAWRDLGAFLANRGKFQEAEEAFLKTLQLIPEDPESHIYLGALYRVTKRVEQALSEFEKAIELDPNNFSAWNNLGYTYRGIGQIQKAIEAYERALTIDPGKKEIEEILLELKTKQSF